MAQNDIIHETIRRNLIRLREQKKLLRSHLAKRAGTQTIYISHIERGDSRPSGVMLAKLAEALDCSIAEFLVGSSKVARDLAKRGL